MATALVAPLEVEMRESAREAYSSRADFPLRGYIGATAMVDTIYIEEDIRTHPRTLDICSRFPKATRIGCERYGEVFNPRAQNFRLQKQRPALILARKHDGHVQAAPDGYGIGGVRNFYFSHMLNCLYDCRYCFLQGMFQSGHYVVFVNYEDFAAGIDTCIAESPEEPTFFFSGYDCDSLAFDEVTKFGAFILDFFAGKPGSWLELRTKSTRIESLLARSPLENCVVAFSFTPEEVSTALEHGVPRLERRLEAMRRLEDRGWKLGVRFDPLIYQEGYEAQYRGLFRRVFEAVDPARLHSVSLGAFRLPRGYFKKMVKLYPEERLFASPLEDRDGMVSYRADLHDEILGRCTEEVLKFVPRDRFFPCLSGAPLE